MSTLAKRRPRTDRPAVPALEATNIKKSFGGLLAVDDATLRVEEGKITGLIGPNGAGKTTLFNLLTRFESIDAGEIRLFGESIGSVAPHRLAARGLLRSFQTPSGFPRLSVLENLMVAGMSQPAEGLAAALIGRSRWSRAAADTRERAERHLARAGLEALRDVPLEDIPGGDMKVVDFCRLLMSRPRLLLLDEPAAGVDPTSIDRLREQLRTLRDEGITVLIVEHNVSFVMDISDYIYVLDQGRIVFEGVPDEVSRSSVVRQVYLGVENAPS